MNTYPRPTPEQLAAVLERCHHDSTGPERVLIGELMYCWRMITEARPQIFDVSGYLLDYMKEHHGRF